MSCADESPRGSTAKTRLRRTPESIHMVEIAKDLGLDHSRRQHLVQQIRLSRATLGSILEWLESSDLSPELWSSYTRTSIT